MKSKGENRAVVRSALRSGASTGRLIRAFVVTDSLQYSPDSANAVEGGKIASEMIHDRGDALVLLQSIHWTSLGHWFAGREPRIFSRRSPAVRRNDDSRHRKGRKLASRRIVW